MGAPRYAVTRSFPRKQYSVRDCSAAVRLVDRRQRLMPALDPLLNGSGLSGPDERLGAAVVFGEVAVNRCLEVDQGVEHAAVQAAPREFGEKSFCAFSHLPVVGPLGPARRQPSSPIERNCRRNSARLTQREAAA